MTKPLFSPDDVSFAALEETCPVVAGGIVSKPLLNTPALRQVIFAVDSEQEMSEHRAPFLATVHVLRGRMAFTAGGTTREMAAGDWVVMPPDEPHALSATEPTIFLLTLARADRTD